MASLTMDLKGVTPLRVSHSDATVCTPQNDASIAWIVAVIMSTEESHQNLIPIAHPFHIS